MFDPDNVLSPLASVSLTSGTSSAITGILGNTADSAMRNLLGAKPCPSGAGGGQGSGDVNNDPCGSGNNALLNAIADLGMALAGPSIAEAGKFIGSGLDTGIGTISSTLGDGIGLTTNTIGGALGMEPDSSGQAIISSSLGAGVVSVTTGQSTTASSTNILTSAAATASNENTTDYFSSVKSAVI